MKIKRTYRIIVALSSSKEQGIELLAESLVSAGLAAIKSDAKKIIKKSISDVNLDDCFIVACSHDFRRSALVNSRLIRMAIAGTPVFLSCKTVPDQLLQFCDVIYPGK